MGNLGKWENRLTDIESEMGKSWEILGKNLIL